MTKKKKKKKKRNSSQFITLHKGRTVMAKNVQNSETNEKAQRTHKR